MSAGLSLPTARVFVLGDAGVGKSTLVHRLATGAAPARTLAPTVGCAPEVVLHTSSRTGRDVFIELFDIGGASRHSAARRTFYRGACPAGLLLVHDLTNRNSRANLFAWLSEIAAVAGDGSLRGESTDEGESDSLPPRVFDPEFYMDTPASRWPIVVVGTKRELESDVRAHARRRDATASGGGQGTSTDEKRFALLGANTCEVSALSDVGDLAAPGSELGAFFDAVAERATDEDSRLGVSDGRRGPPGAAPTGAGSARRLQPRRDERL